jgi:hypothetical protein
MNDYEVTVINNLGLTELALVKGVEGVRLLDCWCAFLGAENVVISAFPRANVISIKLIED